MCSTFVFTPRLIDSLSTTSAGSKSANVYVMPILFTPKSSLTSAPTPISSNGDTLRSRALTSFRLGGLLGKTRAVNSGGNLFLRPAESINSKVNFCVLVSFILVDILTVDSSPTGSNSSGNRDPSLAIKFAVSICLFKKHSHVTSVPWTADTRTVSSMCFWGNSVYSG